MKRWLKWIIPVVILVVLYIADAMERKEHKACIEAGGSKVIFGICYKMIPIDVKKGG